MKDKKLYTIIVSFLFVIIITYSIATSSIEAPLVPHDLMIKQEIEERARAIANEKYKIVSRSVLVPINILNKEKTVLLTIDDGPGPNTQKVIDILKKHNAKAIFFINGMHNKKYPDVIENIINEGFNVGNHTWSHLNLKKETDTKIIEKEILENEELIKKITGNTNRFFRAPYGESNTYIRKFIKENGMIFMDWSGSALDWDKSTIEKDIFINNVMNNIHPGTIILIHEHPWSVANLDALLNSIESKGYTYINPNNIIE